MMGKDRNGLPKGLEAARQDALFRGLQWRQKSITRRTSDGLKWGLRQVKAPGRPIMKIPVEAEKG
jgi:hypothetical protein